MAEGNKSIADILLGLKVNLEDKDFIDGIKDMKNKANDFGKSLKQIAGFSKGLFALESAKTAISILKSVTSSVIECTKEFYNLGTTAALSLEKLSRETGISAGALQEWQLLAERMNIPVDTITSAFEEIRRKQNDLRSTGQYDMGFLRTGIRYSSKESPEKVIDRIVERLKRIPNMNDKIRFLDMAGLSHDLVMLEKVSGKLQEFKSWKKLKISPVEIEQLTDVKGKFSALGKYLNDIWVKFAAKLAPIFNAIADSIVEIVNSVVDWADKNAKVDDLILDIADGIKAVGKFLVSVINVISKIIKAVTAWNDKTGAITALVKGLIILSGVIVGILAGIVVSLGAALAPLIASKAIIATIITYLALAVGYWWKWIGGIEGIKKSWEGFRLLVKYCWQEFKKDAASFWNDIKTVIKNIKTAFINVADTIRTAFKSAMDYLYDKFIEVVKKIIGSKAGKLIAKALGYDINEVIESLEKRKSDYKTKPVKSNTPENYVLQRPQQPKPILLPLLTGQNQSRNILGLSPMMQNRVVNGDTAINNNNEQNNNFNITANITTSPDDVDKTLAGLTVDSFKNQVDVASLSNNVGGY